MVKTPPGGGRYLDHQTSFTIVSNVFYEEDTNPTDDNHETV